MSTLCYTANFAACFACDQYDTSCSHQSLATQLQMDVADGRIVMLSPIAYAVETHKQLNNMKPLQAQQTPWQLHSTLVLIQSSCTDIMAQLHVGIGRDYFPVAGDSQAVSIPMPSTYHCAPCWSDSRVRWCLQ